MRNDEGGVATRKLGEESADAERDLAQAFAIAWVAGPACELWHDAFGLELGDRPAFPVSAASLPQGLCDLKWDVAPLQHAKGSVVGPRKVRT